MILLAQTLLYIAAVAGVAAGSMGALYFAGPALNRARPTSVRLRSAALSLLCLCGIVAAAAAGFVGAPAILYLATR